MIWYLLAIFSAILIAASSIIEKKTLNKEHAMEFSAVMALYCLVIAIPFFFLIDYTQLQTGALAILFVATIFGSIAYVLVEKSVRHTEISLSSPLLVLGPAITVFFAFLFLHETISGIQLFGLLILIVGAYILETKGTDLLEPLRMFKKSRYVHYILVALMLYGITSVIDRILLGDYQMQVEAYIAFLHLFMAIDMIIMLTIFHDGFKGIARGTKSAGLWIVLAAALTFGSRYAYGGAVSMIAVGLVMAIKRTSALFSTVIGGEIFHDRQLLKRSIACLVMVIGAVLVVI